MYGSFKELLLGTGLQHRFHAMSHIGIFLEGTKASEAERGTFRSPAPILFIPHGDGKTDTYKVRTIKVQISKKIAGKCPLFTGGESEKYLQFFEMVSGFIRKKNPKTDTNIRLFNLKHIWRLNHKETWQMKLSLIPALKMPMTLKKMDRMGKKKTKIQGR